MMEDNELERDLAFYREYRKNIFLNNCRLNPKAFWSTYPSSSPAEWTPEYKSLKLRTIDRHIKHLQSLLAVRKAMAAGIAWRML